MKDPDAHALPSLIVERLRCPQCGTTMATDETTDGVTCENGHFHARHLGVLELAATAIGGSTERTFASFGYEWNAFDAVNEEDEEFAEVYFRDIDLESLKGKVGLDAGCGKGRYTRFLASYLEAEVALDGSSAVEAAARNLQGMENVAVVRSDLRKAPFAPESFDFISSLGVLHHLDDPFEGFKELLTYLAPKGQIFLYLYSRPEHMDVRAASLAAAKEFRKLTVRIPHKYLKPLSTPVAAVLYAGVVYPGEWGERHGSDRLAALPMNAYRGKPFRSLVLDTFDRLSAPVEHRYVWSELQEWFDKTGLVVDSAREETGWFVSAHRP